MTGRATVGLLTALVIFVRWHMQSAICLFYSGFYKPHWGAQQVCAATHAPGVLGSKAWVLTLNPKPQHNQHPRCCCPVAGCRILDSLLVHSRGRDCLLLLLLLLLGHPCDSPCLLPRSSRPGWPHGTFEAASVGMWRAHTLMLLQEVSPPARLWLCCLLLVGQEQIHMYV